MSLGKMGWVLGLASILLISCNSTDVCDFTVIVNDLNQPDGSDSIDFHDVAPNAKIAQSFRPATSFILANISFTIKKVENPQATLRVSIHEKDNNENRPEDDPITDGGPVIVDLSEISDNFFTEVKAVFPDEPDLDSGRDYYFVINSVEDLDEENYFQLGSVSTDTAYPDGEVWHFNSDVTDEDEAWDDSTEDLQFRIEKCEEDEN